MRTRLACLAVAAAVVVDILLLTTGPASAAPERDTHTGQGVLAIESQRPISPTQVYYVVRLTWSGDAHPAEKAYITATVVDFAGKSVPVALYPLDKDGRYAGTVKFAGPGVWTVRFNSALPPATYDHTEVVTQNLLESLLPPQQAPVPVPVPAKVA